MPYAVTLRLNEPAASRVVSLWRALAAAGVSDECLTLGYPPHLTLGIFPDGSDEAALAVAMRTVAARSPRRAFFLSGLGVFPGTPATLFLAPVVTVDLLSLHADLLAETGDLGIDPHYRPGRWVPHVTLASDLPDPASGLAALPAQLAPIEGDFDAMEVVRFRPVMVLARAILV